MKRHEFNTLIVFGVMFVGVVLLAGAVVDCERSLAYAAPPTIGDLAVEAPSEDVGEEATASMDVSPLIGRYHPLRGPADPTLEEARLISVAAYRCDRSANRYFRPDVALRILRAEEQAGFGPRHPLRGIFLAQWCSEAAYGIGDEVCSRGACDGGRARGPFQMHPGYARMCAGLPYVGPATDEADLYRDNPEAGVRCLAQQIQRVYATRAQDMACRSEADRWLAAQVWVVRGTRPASCRTLSQHGLRLLRWRGQR